MMHRPLNKKEIRALKNVRSIGRAGVHTGALLDRGLIKPGPYSNCPPDYVLTEDGSKLLRALKEREA